MAQDITEPRRDEKPNVTPSQVNKYYKKVSARFRLCAVVTSFLLLGFILLMLLSFGGRITTENLRFLLRDLGSAASEEEAQLVGSIRYDEDGSRSFALFRGSLAAAGESSVSIYRLSGRKILEESISYAKPTVAVSDKYLIVYDLGGYSFSVYNSLAGVYSETLEYPISAVTVADNGSFAVTTRVREYRSTVLLYNKNFTLIGRYNKDKYVTDTLLSSDGKNLVIAAFDVADGDYYTDLSGYAVGAETPVFAVTLTGSCPLSLTEQDGGGFMLLSDDAARFYDKIGTEKSAYPFGAGEIVASACNGKRNALLLSENKVGKKNTLIIFDTEGNLIYNYNINDTVTGISYTDRAAVLLFENGVGVYREDGSSSFVGADTVGTQKIIPAGGNLLFCRATGTETISID